SLVEARDENGVRKLELDQKFQVLIDAVAMRKGLAGTDAYLEEGRRGKRLEREGTAEEVASAVKAEIEAEFSEIKAAALGKD
ncbi:MAG: virulence factor, partial [Alphaproteobacteria bacterium]|nr:virulence factor [Alphaproteobacteria bacterium]